MCTCVRGRGGGIFNFQQHEGGARAQVQEVPLGQGASHQAVRLEVEDLGLERENDAVSKMQPEQKKYIYSPGQMCHTEEQEDRI